MFQYNISKTTGFFNNPTPSSEFVGEVAHIVRPNPSQDVRRSGITLSEKKDGRIKDLIKKASIAYIVDAMVRQAVDKFSELFKNFAFEGEDGPKKYLEDRLTQMSIQNGEHWETLFTRIIQEYFKNGNAFIVKVRGGNTKTTQRALYQNKPYAISGLSLISADRLDVSRDEKGNFLGWELSGTRDDAKLSLVLPSATRLDPDKALIKVAAPPVEKKNILLPGADIVQIAYKKGADSHWGFGVTLAALEDITMTRNLEQSTAIMMKKFSNPIIHHKILRPSSPLAGIQQEINAAYELYRRMSPDGVLITGGNAEIKAVGSESQALRVEGYLKYFLHRSLAGLGISPYLMGLEGGGQGTVEAATELMMMKVRFCQAEIAREIELFIINELLWEGNFDPYTKEEHRVKLVFDDIDEDRVIKHQTHAADMFAKQIIDHDEARKMGKIRSKYNDQELYLNKVEIPKTKAEADAKGSAQKDAGVAIAKAKPKPKTAKEIMDIIQNLIPEKEEHLSYFLQIMEKKYSFDSSTLNELLPQIKNLLGDAEAIKVLLIEALTE